ncbi:undecaprenyldiphospho-muramoylpentapeptide beta-N-acetylglucosaminyltransferase [Ktedonosporobacter rubrisoli]|uniref:UDP-N-acetylglucosamine--N-acetylmuramyl-(pentapeptide) pyrophosphoryl-undecaprenol N-acetylglucosamine transferase n=1 Tax=Ktedonosporobacter rubrisoli TaxID=2509675 RepID=A0A4V0YZX0_KTERU|nr:undecaprenyldiphospho-muramoylpentapeptide beta-N-acetylglucosaminyltransferase [Ktedonosporobacter rubrisoli]QBD81191.1 undecaprenyldiphospho-muramoylpentapeptide beta-N-acetylglucosaminyltransferase [Ktedonosporobacter rubrisoli]
MRVLISGGGTGGHVYPALAVATQLRNTYNADILYLGSDDGLETEVVPAAGFRFKAIKAGKLQRFVSWRTVTGVARVPVGIAQAIGIVRDFHPHVAFTSGGYVAVPAGLAAKLNNVPLLMHQQDVPPNLSNQLLAPLATRISVAFADSCRHFPASKTIHLGNPVRQEILAVRQTTPEQARSALGLDPAKPLLLVTGGSSGARHLNQVVCRALPELLKYCQVLQISGRRLYDETRELAEQVLAGQDSALRQSYRLEAYLSAEMPLALQAAALVICRSGASTLSELATLARPSILVPLPTEIGASPQEGNAAMFKQRGAAIVILNDDLTPESLNAVLKPTITSAQRLQELATAAGKLAMPNAGQQIVETIVSMSRVKPAMVAEHEGIHV